MTSSDFKVSIVSESIIFPDSESPIESLRLTASDLPMLTFQYIQKGCLFSGHPNSGDSFVSHLKLSLSKTLSIFPPLAGRLSTDPDYGHISVECSGAGALFVHARATSLSLNTLLHPSDDNLKLFRRFFALDDVISYAGHSSPLAAVQVTDLADGVFIGCSLNHAVVDGTSFWNFFNTFSEISRGVKKISRPPFFPRDNVFSTTVAGVRPPAPAPKTFSGAVIRERIFHFSRESLLALKKTALKETSTSAEISSFQSLCAHLWRSVTRARELPSNKTTTFSMAVNCRSRVEPEMDPVYFGNAVQIITTWAKAGEVVSNGIGWGADLLHRGIVGRDDRTVREEVMEWERDPQCFEVGKSDGAMIVVGSSPRFPMYENDFGWGPPVAVRSGKTTKFDGCLSAFPGREGGGSVDFEVVLVEDTMARLEKDPEFIKFVG